MIKHSGEEFYGTTTVGEKGQIVIPAEARSAMKLKKGEKLLVFGMGDMIACAKFAEAEKFAAHLAGKVAAIKKIIKNSN